MSKLETPRPPWIARLLGRLIVGHGADSLRGDLHESFERRVMRDGNSFGGRASHMIDVLSSVLHWWWSSLRPGGHSGIAEDVRYGARMLGKHAAFTVVAVISLGVGIGATTTVFSAVNAVLLRPLPVKDPETLVTVNKPSPTTTPIHAISYPELLDYRARTNVFSGIAAWTERSASIELDGQPEQAYGVLVTGNYFWVLGGQPALGRVFTTEVDEAPGGHPVVVLSHAFWRRRFGSDSSIIGRRLMLNGLPFTVIGVAPKGFTSTYNIFAPAFYAPVTMEAQLVSQPRILESRGTRNLKLTARIKPGVTREQAQAALNVIDAQLERERLEPGEKARPHVAVELVPVGAYPVDIQLAMFGIGGLLVAIVGSVLLIACANVAGMLLARATVRRREMAVRLAIGATRRRLIRQLLTETLLLFSIAATLGVALTVWLTRLASAVSLPAAVPFAIDAKVDWLVLGFTLVLALVTGLVFGLAPALEGSRVDLHTALKDTPAAGASKRARLRHAFVVAQITLSLVLLIAGGLFERALEYAQTIYPGQNPETILTATVDPEPLGYSGLQASELYRRLIERASALPGVEAASMVQELAIGPDRATTSLAFKDHPELGTLRSETNQIAPDYFRTLGIRLISGRDFTSDDRETSARVAIVTESTARRFWPGRSPLGKLVRVGGDEWAEIVGIAEDGPPRARGQAMQPFVYRPSFQSKGNNTQMTLLLRYHGDKSALLDAVRRETRALDARLPLQAPVTLSAAVEIITIPWRVAGALARWFGIIGLSLAALGIYGLVSYTVSQRTREIGVRVALGADPRSIRGLVVGHGLKLALSGVAIGIAISLGATRVLTAFLFGVSASDPATYVGQSLLLIAVAAAASYVPARKATKTDPLVALRHE